MSFQSFYTFILLLALVNPILPQSENKQSVSVTVYNNNLGIVKESRVLKVQSGVSEIFISDVAQQIEPTSVHINIDGKVLEQNYQFDLVSLSKILKKYVDRTVTLVNDKGEKTQGILLSAFGHQIVLKKNDGSLLMLPNIEEYQISVDKLPGGLITRPTLIWKVDSPKRGNQNVEISYQTSGLNWHAEYIVVLSENDSNADLDSWVSIENNSGKTFENTKLKLVAGDVHRAERPKKYIGIAKNELAMSSRDARQFSEKPFFEYHIYKLKNRTTLANNEVKQISLFKANGLNIHKKYYFKSGAFNDNSLIKIPVVIEFYNSKENNLGEPMPKGKVRVFKSDGESMEFIGEDWIDHTPKNEKIKLHIGNAFDVLAESKMTESKRISDKVYEREYSLVLTNRKDSDITVHVERLLNSNWEIISANRDFKKLNSQSVLFTVPVKSDSKSELKFNVRNVK